MRIAVIDIGTNTFELIVAEKNGSTLNVVHFNEVPVKIGKNGMVANHIEAEAFQRGLHAVELLLNEAQGFNPVNIYAIATSAIRNAVNGEEFVQAVHKQFRLKTEVITGDEEAALVFLGVREVFDPAGEPFLIMDIGGGSVEFIIANAQEILWKRSFDLGVTRLFEQIQPDDPITRQQIDRIEGMLLLQLKPLAEAMKTHRPLQLVGASGAFESIVDMLYYKSPQKRFQSGQLITKIKLDDYRPLHQRLVNSTIAERHQMEGLVEMRVVTIPLASIVTRYIIDHFWIQNMYQSNYALKEGAVLHFLEQVK